MCLQKLIVRPVLKAEEARFRDLMQRHHYLKFVPKMGQTLWYVGCIEGSWTSLLSFFGGGIEVPGSGQVDWMGISPPIRSFETDRQQQPVSDFAGLAY